MSNPSAKTRRAAARPFETLYSRALRLAGLARPKKRACRGGVSRYCRPMARLICERLAVHGESLQTICARSAFPSTATVYNWLRAHPEFARMYGEARAFQGERLMDQ